MEGFGIVIRHNPIFISETLEAIWKMNWGEKSLEEEKPY